MHYPTRVLYVDIGASFSYDGYGLTFVDRIALKISHFE